MVAVREGRREESCRGVGMSEIIQVVKNIRVSLSETPSKSRVDNEHTGDETLSNILPSFLKFPPLLPQLPIPVFQVVSFSEV